SRASGIIGLPLRLLAREIYDRICAIRGASQVALITGEEKIQPAGARHQVCARDEIRYREFPAPPTPPPRPTTDHAPVPSVVGRGGGVGRRSRKSVKRILSRAQDLRGGGVGGGAEKPR
ncbi:MAG: hypothetical protein V3S87_10815, partial [Alphaproteobacteria bacterium]